MLCDSGHIFRQECHCAVEKHVLGVLPLLSRQTIMAVSLPAPDTGGRIDMHVASSSRRSQTCVIRSACSSAALCGRSSAGALIAP